MLLASSQQEQCECLPANSRQYFLGTLYHPPTPRYNMDSLVGLTLIERTLDEINRPTHAQDIAIILWPGTLIKFLLRKRNKTYRQKKEELADALSARINRIGLITCHN